MTGALVSMGRAALLTFLLRLLHARTAEVAEEEAAAAEEVDELAAAEEEEDAEAEDELAEDEEELVDDEELAAVEDEAEEEVDEADEDKDDEEEEAEVAATANELVLLELLLKATDDDDLEVDAEEVVGLTEVELVVGLMEVEDLLSEGVSVLVEEFDVDEAAAEDDETWVEFVGAAEDREDDDREVEEDDVNDDDERELEGDDVGDAAALDAGKEDERVKDEGEDGTVRDEEDGKDDGNSSDDDDDRAAELALDILETLLLMPLLMPLLLNKVELLIDGAELLTTDEPLAAAALLLDEAGVAAADALELELDKELDAGEPIEIDSATCEEVAAAGVDVLRGLEDERVTDEEVEDGFTDEEVEVGFTDVELAFDEVLLAFTEEDEVEVGFCFCVRIMFVQDLFNISYLGARTGRGDLCAAARDNGLA
jgi:hypothetical protein